MGVITIVILISSFIQDFNIIAILLTLMLRTSSSTGLLPSMAKVVVKYNGTDDVRWC